MTAQPVVERGRPAPVAAALVWLSHPVTAVATGLLLLNDHVLKIVWPGWVTGKLSDVAGLVMAPPLLGVVIAVVAPRLGPVLRPALAVGLVGVGFVAVKGFEPAAAWASAWWSVVNGPSVIRSDVTDLLAVPALGIAWWTSRSGRVELRRWVRAAGVLVVLPTAALAVAATSAPQYDDAVAIREWRGRLMVGISNAYHADREPNVYQATDDDGLTFHHLDDSEYREFLAQEPAIPPAGQRDCSDQSPGHCFRVVPGHLRVEESEDGGASWRTAWEVSEPERARLAAEYAEIEDVAEYLSSRVLVVRDQPQGGLVVLVANGRDGLARRDAAGRWARIGFGVTVEPDYVITEAPKPIPAVNPVTVVKVAHLPVALAAIAAGVVLVAGTAIAGRRSRRRSLWLYSTVVAPGAVLALCGLGTPLGASEFLVAGVLLILACGTALVIHEARRRTIAPVGATIVGVLSLTAGAAVLTPHLMWLSTGWPPRAWGLPFGAVMTAVLGLLAAITGVRYAGAPPDQEARAPRTIAPVDETGAEV
jgi:hypothetical protein